MNNKCKAALGLCFIAMSAAAGAQPANLIADGTVAPGGSVPIAVDLDADGTITQLNLVFTYDSTALTPDLTNCGGGNSTVTPGNTSCSNPSAGQINIVHGQFGTTPLTDGTYGTISFTAGAGVAPGSTFDLTLTVESFSNAGGDAVTPSGSSNGTITVECPTGESCYVSTPDIGSSIAFGSAVVGQDTGAQTITVGNAQDDGTTTFDITAASGTGTDVAATASVTGGFPATVPADGGTTTVDVDFVCQPAARGNLSGSITVANDATNPAGDETYPFTCTGLSPNVAVPAGPVALSGTVAGGDPSTAVTVTNPQDGFTSTASNVTATAGAGDAEITVTGGPASIAPDGSADFTVSCDSSAEGSFSRVIDFSWDDPTAGGGTATDSVTVNCTVSDTAPVYESAPTPDADNTSDGTAEIALSSPFGTQSAASTIDVRNANPNTDANPLVINSDGVTLSDTTVFSADLTSTPSFDAGDPLAPAIDLTCTPQGVGTVTATLTVETNDPNEPTGGFLYDLSCEGTGDASVLDPDVGGTLNLGAVAPNSLTPIRSIDLTNNRIPGGGDFGLSCSILSGDTAQISQLTAGTVTVAPGETGSVEYQCQPTAIESYSVAVACSVTSGTVGRGTTQTHTVTCSGRPLVIPTLSHWGLILMSLLVLAIGGLFGRRMMA
jgi:hypothetical protein